MALWQAKGIGVMFGNRWDAWKLRSGWTGESRDIGWAEMIAVELAIYHCEAQGYRDADILIRSDNAGVIGAFARGRSRNTAVNDSFLTA